jgi:hypothetical protein
MIALEDYKYRKRHTWSPITTIVDIGGYRVGYIFSLWPITVFKLKISKITQKDKYVTIIKIFGLEFEKA